METLYLLGKTCIRKEEKKRKKGERGIWLMDGTMDANRLCMGTMESYVRYDKVCGAGMGLSFSFSGQSFNNFRKQPSPFFFFKKKKLQIDGIFLISGVHASISIFHLPVRSSNK